MLLAIQICGGGGKLQICRGGASGCTLRHQEEKSRMARDGENMEDRCGVLRCCAADQEQQHAAGPVCGRCRDGSYHVVRLGLEAPFTMPADWCQLKDGPPLSVPSHALDVWPVHLHTL